MTKAVRKSTTKEIADNALIKLSRRLSNLRSQEIEAGSHALDCDDALVAANARVDAIAAEMKQVYAQILALTPATSEGQRALALAIAQKCADTNEVSAPESELERGIAVLFSALGVDHRAA